MDNFVHLRMEYLYKIVNKVNGRTYIGATRNFKERKSEHFKMLKKGIHKNKFMQTDFDKCGIENFYFEVILSQDDCFSIESEYIEKIGSYNIAKGGIGGDVFNSLPKERQDRIREGVRKRNIDRYKDPAEKLKCSAFPADMDPIDREERLKIWSECKKGPGNGRFKHDKKVRQIDPKTMEILKVWDYARVLSDYGFNPKYVIACCQGKESFNTHKGFKWEWETSCDG